MKIVKKFFMELPNVIIYKWEYLMNIVQLVKVVKEVNK